MKYSSVQVSSGFLELFPRLAILSVAGDTRNPNYASQKLGLYDYQQNLQVTLFKPVTMEDLQSLNWQFDFDSDAGCICFFGGQLGTSIKSGRITVSHITELTVCAGAGIVESTEEPGSRALGKGLRFNSVGWLRLKIQRPASAHLVRPLLSFVLDSARLAKSAEISLACESRIVGTYTEMVSLHIN